MFYDPKNTHSPSQSSDFPPTHLSNPLDLIAFPEHACDPARSLSAELKIRSEAKQMEFHNQLHTTEGTIVRRFLIFKLKSAVLLSLLEALTDPLCFLLQGDPACCEHTEILLQD